MEFTQIFPVWVNEHIGHHLPKIIKSCMSASALNIFFETLQDDTAQFSVPITSQITPLSRESFLRHYGGQLKTAVEQEVGEEIDCKR